MRKLIILTILIFGYIVSFSQNYASCREFALKKESEFFANNDYISDGNYYAKILGPGDMAQVYKPFLRGNKYKIIALCGPNLNGITLQIKDYRGYRLIYESEKPDSLIVWETTPKRSSNYIIRVSVPKNANSEAKEDCVVLLVGFKRASKEQ